MAILNIRPKWRATKENLKGGEFMLIVIRMFHVVRMVEVFPGQDGQVRVFQVSRRGK